MMDRKLAQINQFNRTYNVGDKVKLRFTPSVIETCTVKAPATSIGGKAVVLVEELNDTYPIEKVVY